MGTWVLLVVVSHHQPCSGETEVSTGNRDRLLEVERKPFQILKWPKHTAGQSQTAFRTITTIQTNERAYQFNQWMWLLVWLSPASTQPKHLLKVDGEPEGPNRWMWSIVRLKESASRSRSTLPGVAKSGSARQILDKCFLHLWLNGTRQDGRSMVTWISTTASTAIVFPRSFIILRFIIPG